jgi:V/A-type H+-transporting ATPase subunit C
MPSDAISDFAAINSRVRVMFSTLLTKQDFVNLSETANLEGLLGQLKNTAYGPYFDRVKEKELTARRAAFQIRERLAETFHSIIHSSPGYTRPLLTQLYRNYEINNLKAVLRGITSDSSWDRVRYVLFPLGDESSLPNEAMLETRNVTQAVELLKGTPYYDTLTFAMKRYSTEQSLFPIEVAIDLDYWRDLWKDVNTLLGQDREYASRILGSLLDMNNLMWAIRYRAYHNLSEEEVINYTLPFGYRVRDEDIRNIAAGADIPQIINRLYPKIQGVSELLGDLHSGLPRLELLLQKNVVDQCRAAFVGNPFQIGIPLGYLLLFEFEIQDLIVLFEAKANHIPSENYKNFLLIDL